jgi:hypothetical protein
LTTAHQGLPPLAIKRGTSPLAITRTDKNDATRTRLVQELRTNRMFSMTGAGLSCWAGYPAWTPFLNRLAARVHEYDEAVDITLVQRQFAGLPLQLAGRLGHYLATEFELFIQSQFGPAGGSSLDDVLYRFASLPLQHHISFNFDNSLERTHPQGTNSCDSLTSAKRGELIEFLRLCDAENYVKRVVHLHGLYSDAIEGIVFTEPGYAKFYNDTTFYKKFLWSIFSTRSLLFAGFGFVDEDFLNTLGEWKRDTREKEAHLQHFAIYSLKDGEDDEQIRTRLATEFRVDALFYEVRANADGSQDHREFSNIIQGLTESLGIAGPQRATPAIVIEPHTTSADAQNQRIAELNEHALNRTTGGLPDA